MKLYHPIKRKTEALNMQSLLTTLLERCPKLIRKIRASLLINRSMKLMKNRKKKMEEQ
jgi:hypothetical protein